VVALLIFNQGLLETSSAHAFDRPRSLTETNFDIPPTSRPTFLRNSRPVNIRSTKKYFRHGHFSPTAAFAKMPRSGCVIWAATLSALR